jgi:2'-5' RNA ligase
MPETIRSFIAFDINNPSVLEKFSEVQDVLVKTGADLRLVEPRNIHMTIRFLGDIQASMVDPILEGMKQVEFQAFDCEIHGLGVFPNLSYTRVVWAGMKKGSDELKQVSGQLELHLRKPELANRIQTLTDYDFGIVKADCLKLRKSVLTPNGPIYSTLGEVCR